VYDAEDFICAIKRLPPDALKELDGLLADLSQRSIEKSLDDPLIVGRQAPILRESHQKRPVFVGPNATGEDQV